MGRTARGWAVFRRLATLARLSTQVSRSFLLHSRHRPMDINGDGRADLCVAEGDDVLCSPAP
jgi:hypothetical protein